MKVVIKHISKQVATMKDLVESVSAHGLIPSGSVMNIVHRSGGGCGKSESLLFKASESLLFGAGVVGGSVDGVAYLTQTLFKASWGQNVTEGLAFLTAVSKNIHLLNLNWTRAETIIQYTNVATLQADCAVVCQDKSFYRLLSAGSSRGTCTKPSEELRIQYGKDSAAGVQLFLVWLVKSSKGEDVISGFSFADIAWPVRSNCTLSGVFVGDNVVELRLKGSMGKITTTKASFMDEGGQMAIRTLDRILVQWMRSRMGKTGSAFWRKRGDQIVNMCMDVKGIIDQGDKASQEDLKLAIRYLASSSVPLPDADDFDIEESKRIPLSYIGYTGDIWGRQGGGEGGGAGEGVGGGGGDHEGDGEGGDGEGGGGGGCHSSSSAEAPEEATGGRGGCGNEDEDLETMTVKKLK
jgi:hypothetical protein